MYVLNNNYNILYIEHCILIYYILYYINILIYNNTYYIIYNIKYIIYNYIYKIILLYMYYKN